MLEETSQFLEDGELKRIHVLESKEKLVDTLQREITNFLVKLSQKSISPETSESLGSLMNIVNDLERIGDHCENLWNFGLRKFEDKISFSYMGNNEVVSIADKTQEFLQFVIDAMETGDKTIGVKAIEYEDAIDALEENLRMNHVARLNTGECAVQPGLIFIDMLHSYEKIGDHTYNVSEALIGEK